MQDCNTEVDKKGKNADFDEQYLQYESQVEETPCPVCDAVYLRESFLTKHVEQSHWTVDEDKQTVCIICKMKFSEMSELLPHVRAHRDEMQKCNICEAVFPSLNQVVEHKTLVHGENSKDLINESYQCGDCQEIFDSKSLLSYHRLLIHGSTTQLLVSRPKLKFACQYCELSFSQESKLQKHMAVHEKVSETGNHVNVCSKCFESFEDENSKARHALSCEGPKKYITDGTLTEFPCGICDSVFETLHGVEFHVSSGHWTTQTNLVSCVHCNFTSTSIKDIATHARTHRDSMMPCKRCDDVVFVQGNQLAVHNETVHKNKSHRNDQIYICMLCNENTRSKSLLAFHYLTEHEQYLEFQSEMPVHACPDCKKTFPTYASLKRHMKIHNKKKGARKPRYRCSKCYEVFNVQVLLDKHLSENACLHILTQTDVNTTPNKYENSLQDDSKTRCVKKRKYEYLCTYCGQQYKTKSSLDQHISGHTGIAKYQCTICDRKFVAKHLYKHHMASHNKPFVCTQCGARFGYAAHLKGHELTHTDKRDWSCEVCGEAFRWRLSMLSHLYKAHNIGKDVKDRKKEAVACNLCNTKMDRYSFRRHCTKAHPNVQFSYRYCRTIAVGNTESNRTRRANKKTKEQDQTVLIPEMNLKMEEASFEEAVQIPQDVALVCEPGDERLETYIYSEADIPEGVAQIVDVQSNETITACVANVINDGSIEMEEWTVEINIPQE